MSGPKRAILEALLVAIAGVSIGLTANAMNRDGLKLGRNYYPPPKPVVRPTSTSVPSAQQARRTDSPETASETAETVPAPVPSPPVDSGSNACAPVTDENRAQVEYYALVAMPHEQVVELFHDPLYDAGLYMIIDARDGREYAEGHIPGAYHLFYYQEERYIDEVLPTAQAAEKIVVYCNGGDCEDSVLTAGPLLRDTYFIDPSRLFVYIEGYDCWKKSGLPVERGVRGSGDIVGGGK